VAEANGKTGQRGMGRGLAALLANGGTGNQPAFREVALELIRPNPKQPRHEFDGESLLALSESIKARGVLQPIVVRPLPGGSYELIAGERRLRAAKLAGLEQVPAIVRDTEEGERLELALIENMAREDLNPIEEARACATLVDDLGVTKEELGRRVGRSRVAISNSVRLLDLPDEAQAMIQAGELSAARGATTEGSGTEGAEPPPDRCQRAVVTYAVSASDASSSRATPSGSVSRFSTKSATVASMLVVHCVTVLDGGT